jgi:hypothetical protein
MSDFRIPLRPFLGALMLIGIAYLVWFYSQPADKGTATPEHLAAMLTQQLNKKARFMGSDYRATGVVCQSMGGTSYECKGSLGGTALSWSVEKVGNGKYRVEME